MHKCDVVYEIPCKTCKKKYIGETGRQFHQRLHEHRSEVEKEDTTRYTRVKKKKSEEEMKKSAITDHAQPDNHVIDWEEAGPIDSESDKLKREIREAIWIRRRAPTMNRMEGAYKLSHVWTGLVSTTPPSGERKQQF